MAISVRGHDATFSAIKTEGVWRPGRCADIALGMPFDSVVNSRNDSRLAMQRLQQFMIEHSGWVFLLTFLWVAIGFGWRFYRHKRTGVVFPAIDKSSIRFDQRNASGASHKTIFTKFGGANNCLHVTVTDTEVWIRPIFPFIILAQQLDLEHRIPIASITKTELVRSTLFRRVVLNYEDGAGRTHRLTLTLQKPDDFLKAAGMRGRV